METKLNNKSNGQESKDAISRWINEECVVDGNSTSATAELFTSWKVWAKRSGEFIGTKRRFSDDLFKRGFKHWRNSHKRGFRGLALRDGVTQ